MTLLPQETIIRKRDGLTLGAEEIAGFIAGLTDGSVGPAQAAAFAMAVYFRDMTTPERVALTEAMRDSRHRARLVRPRWSRRRQALDRRRGGHTSLMLAPILAACGVYVPMISGRGLGHTGGTLDKFDHPRLQHQPGQRPVPQGGARGRLRHYRPDRRSRPGRQGALRHPRRHRHGRIHSADHRLDPVEESSRLVSGR
jgi:hypothetical protein